MKIATKLIITQLIIDTKMFDPGLAAAPQLFPVAEKRGGEQKFHRSLQRRTCGGFRDHNPPHPAAAPPPAASSPQAAGVKAGVSG